MERVVERVLSLLFFFEGVPSIEAAIWSSVMCVPGPGESLVVEERDCPGRARLAMVSCRKQWRSLRSTLSILMRLER